ncbi:MAG: hypothetical protein IH927_02150 [Proteobacteria bacterium]|nr:hypothetical protein [Pseudomonadota bacterium]
MTLSSEDRSFKHLAIANTIDFPGVCLNSKPLSLLAINSARGGNNLVIHGPPGTGKSQTIANMIATFMAEGKSVLFVSEKTAALDVVKDRLDENGLGVFCLDLHSERGKKANVYRQLQESVDDPGTVRRLELD